MPKRENIYLQCPRKDPVKLPDKTEVRCNHVWKYEGKAIRRTTCPKCGTTVTITKSAITEKEYNRLKAIE